MIVALAVLAALAPAPAMAARPEPGARYADTDYAFWVDLRVSQNGRFLVPRSRAENLSSWTCPGLDFRFGRRVRIRPDGRFEYRRRRGRFLLTVSGRFRTRELARITMRYRRAPVRRGRDCDDSGRVSLAPRRVAPLRVSDCRTHAARTLLLTPAGRVFWHDTWLGRDGWGVVAYGCLFSLNRPFALGQDNDDDNDLDRFRLVEPFVAYEHSECPMGCVFSLHVQDLRDGRVRHLPREPGDAFGQVTDIVLRENGSVAWIARPSQYFGLREPAVRADDGQASRLLDTGNIELDSLELNGSTLTWTRDAAPQSATLD
jgi:hypothetical protein